MFPVVDSGVGPEETEGRPKGVFIVEYVCVSLWEGEMGWFGDGTCFMGYYAAIVVSLFAL